MDFIYGLAFNLLLKVLFDKPAVHLPEPPPPRPSQSLMVEAQERLVIPDWVTSPPSGCVVGISRPCPSVAEAREQALQSAVSQILEALGAEYSLHNNYGRA